MKLLSRINKLIESSQPFCIATIIESQEKTIVSGNKILFFPDGTFESNIANLNIDSNLLKHVQNAFSNGKTSLIEISPGLRIFFDIITEQPKLIICGAGHIAIPLVKFMNALDFSITVIDDRPEFANEKRFKNCSVIAQNYVSVLKTLPINDMTYVVIITRGHEHDVECLTEILKRETAYTGLIGSRRRVGFVMKMLEKQGIPNARLNEVFTPIGLPIGARSPEEIALSIASELVSFRRKGNDWTKTLRNTIDGIIENG